MSLKEEHKGKTEIRELSKSKTVQSNWVYDGDSSSRIYPDLYNSVSAGCLQRIADSIESMDRSLKVIAAASEDIPGRSELFNQVSKLSMRLKAAGLDGDPKSDNRGRSRGKKSV